MQNPHEVGEDIFFDSLDYVSTSFSSASCEDAFTGNPELEPETFDCQVWVNDLRTICERRNSFLHRMGFDEFVHSEMNCSQRVNQEHYSKPSQCLVLDRIMDTNDTVLDSSICGSDRKDGDQHCVRDLGRGNTSVVHDLCQHSLLSTTPREVDSGRRWDDCQISFGLSQSVQQSVLKEKSCEERQGGGVVTREKKLKSWWKGFYARRHSGELCECNISDHNVKVCKAGRRKVQRHGKSYREFTAVYMGQEFQAHKGSIWTMKFSPDGRYLATGGEDYIVRVWHVVEVESSCNYLTGVCVPEFVDKMKEYKFVLKNRCSGSAPMVIPEKIFKLEETPLHEFHGHTSDVLDLSWSESNCLLTSSKDKTVRMWQVGHDYCLKVFQHNNYVTCVQFNPIDDGHFISGSIDGKVRIWKISENRVIDWVDIRDIITAVCYRPDGQGFVAGSIIGGCRFYHSAGNCLQLNVELNIQGKKRATGKSITGFQFDPEDPKRVMITSADSRVGIINGGDVIHKYGGLRKLKNQFSASFTSDGRFIVSVGEDSHIYIWNYDYSDGPSTKGTKSVSSCEYFFSKDASVAVPWPGMYNMESGRRNDTSHVRQVRILEPSSCARDTECFSLASCFFPDCPVRASATWPEEKLGLCAETAGAVGFCPRDRNNYHEHHLKPLSPGTWSRVIVTAGHDGSIRAFHHYGLPVRP